ncbi:MAG: hypothetical protein QM784_28035 [Polyangiaceae bacterium]
MVASFNSALAKLGRIFRGTPIYVGHPDVDPARYPDTRRVGKVMKLEAREDGLWGQAAWNTLGEENRQQGFHVYPSPFWLCVAASNGQGIEPVELVSVGLTNTPNIRTSRPATANDAGASAANDASVTGLIANVRKALTDAGVMNAADKDEVIITAVGNLISNIGYARQEADRRKQELDAAIKAKNDATAAHRDALLDHAIESGRITKAEREGLVAAFNDDFAKAAETAKAKTPAYNTAELSLARDRAPLADRARAARGPAEGRGGPDGGRQGPDLDDAWAAAKRGIRRPEDLSCRRRHRLTPSRTHTPHPSPRP